MADMENRTDEFAMAIAVMRIIRDMQEECADLDQLRDRITETVDLTDDDWEPSDSIPTQPKWHQILRNINSNRFHVGNFIYEGYLEHLDGGGYCITEKGEQFLRRLRL